MQFPQSCTYCIVQPLVPFKIQDGKKAHLPTKRIDRVTGLFPYASPVWARSLFPSHDSLDSAIVLRPGVRHGVREQGSLRRRVYYRHRRLFHGPLPSHPSPSPHLPHPQSLTTSHSWRQQLGRLVYCFVPTSLLTNPFHRGLLYRSSSAL